MKRAPDPPRRWTWPHYRFGQWLVPKIMRIRGGWQVEGHEQVPAEGGAVIAANHLSHLDPPMVGAALRRRTYYFAKSELFANPLFALLIRKCYAFPVKRGTADTTALKHAIAILKADELLTMFPEGTRSPDGELGEFDLGAALAASRAGVPIVPCAISGTEVVLPPGAKFMRRGSVAVSFGRPVDTLQYGPKPRKGELRKITERVESQIRAMKDKQRSLATGERTIEEHVEAEN